MVQKYLNRKDVRRQLGVSDSVLEFRACNGKIEEEFNRNGELFRTTTAEIVYLLDNKVSVLIYAGEFDWMCVELLDWCV